MNLLFNSKKPEYEVFLYEYNKSYDELLKTTLLNKDEHKKLNSFTSKKRKKEWVATRNILQSIYGNETRITFKEKQPFINKKKYISLSHTGNMVAIITSNTNIVGIDVEKENKIILKFAHKFIHKKEENLFKKTNRLLTTNLLWSAKESLYKAYGLGGLIFNKEMFIEKINWKKELAIGKIKTNNYNKTFKILFKKTKNYLLAYAICT